MTKTEWLAQYMQCVAQLERLRHQARIKWVGPDMECTEEWDKTIPHVEDDHMETFYAVRATAIVFSQDHKVQ